MLESKGYTTYWSYTVGKGSWVSAIGVRGDLRMNALKRVVIAWMIILICYIGVSVISPSIVKFKVSQTTTGTQAVTSEFTSPEGERFRVSYTTAEITTTIGGATVVPVSQISEEAKLNDTEVLIRALADNQTRAYIDLLLSKDCLLVNVIASKGVLEWTYSINVRLLHRPEEVKAWTLGESPKGGFSVVLPYAKYKTLIQEEASVYNMSLPGDFPNRIYVACYWNETLYSVWAIGWKEKPTIIFGNVKVYEAFYCRIVHGKHCEWIKSCDECFLLEKAK